MVIQYTVDGRVFGDSGMVHVIARNKREYWRETLVPKVSTYLNPDFLVAVFVDPDDGLEKIWSESNVSEDFDMALRLQMRGYVIRCVRGWVCLWGGC
jgi:cellulose synthase/poly-beta-1,6-N-acetylglucosamine synthase-like glycosyltransferase